jgi:hypothetical protein
MKGNTCSPRSKAGQIGFPLKNSLWKTFCLELSCRMEVVNYQTVKKAPTEVTLSLNAANIYLHVRAKLTEDDMELALQQ